ncbi:hypothetical protein [Phenylobacterium sp.]|uniref:hypothetical protein n=1 Tax=Phenylobacterium sp. TaxID=1871053 RepID=UPI0027316C3B|nr:hypothetical protein [Phenylobacterium sp.]MDP1874349.1 hypothetical protein [Phenylobacterium sp.]MDP3300093.1 hypothetical protein [Phenylobacterium sp.]
MFVGHYAAAIAAKAIEPRGPLWVYVLAAQLVDVAWGALIITGVERVSVDPDLPGSALVLEHMPYTHSLPAAAAWSVLGGLAARLVLRLPWAAAMMVGAVVFSHWLLDFLVHRPDLALWFGGPKVGLGLWDYPVPEQAVEIGLIAMAGAAWAWSRGRQGLGLVAAPAFIGFLVALQIVAMLLPADGDPVGMGVSAIVAFLVVTLMAAFADRPVRPPAG